MFLYYIEMNTFDSIKIHKIKNNLLSYLGMDQDCKFSEIIIKNSEIIQVNNQVISNPLDRIKVDKLSFNKYNSSTTDKLIEIKLLMPPIIINLNADKASLSLDEIEYFKSHGSNATIFIHGFSTKAGGYSNQLINASSNIYQGLEYSDSLRTIYIDPKKIANQYSDGYEIIDDCHLNGTEAHNWFIHMENNLNIATGQFNNKDYRSYFRLINIIWPGDLFFGNFIDAEDNADQSGVKLAKVINQLKSHDIEVNIIAHSLGARVALSLMQELASKGSVNSIEHVILWQAAVPNTILNEDPTKDRTVKYKSHFTLAHKSCKNITILYSHRDKILKYIFYLSEYIGISIRQFIYLNESVPYYSDMLDRVFIETWKATTKYLEYVNLESKHLLQTDDIDYDDLFSRMKYNIDKLMYPIKKPLAMGYQGADTSDPMIMRLIKEKKLLQINQTFLSSHSGMKIPDQAMKVVYKKWIINKYTVINKFGGYVL